MNVREIGAGERGGVEPPRRVSGRRCGRSRRQRSPVQGAARTGEHGVLRRRAEAMPAAGAAGEGRARRGLRRARCAAPARGDHGDPAGDAAEPCRQGAGPATAVSEASRRASGARSDRRERRREGYPPEGPRPRSGLGRVARSRSDAPSLIVGIPALVTVIGTLTSITVCATGIGITVTVVCTNGVNTDANIVATRCALSSSTSRW